MKIGNEILEYLIDHPEAQDTLQGIVEWWLLEQTIKFKKTQVEKALAELIAKGLIIEKKGSDSQTRYRINHRKHKDIQILLKTKRGSENSTLG